MHSRKLMHKPYQVPLFRNDHGDLILNAGILDYLVGALAMIKTRSQSIDLDLTISRV